MPHSSFEIVSGVKRPLARRIWSFICYRKVDVRKVRREDGVVVIKYRKVPRLRSETRSLLLWALLLALSSPFLYLTVSRLSNVSLDSGDAPVVDR
jgi:hypothetical protein